MSTPVYDVVIVGAGPAGMISSIHAEREGLDTLLLEKQEVPRDKPCGGCISVRSENVLKDIGIILSEDIIEKEVYGMEFYRPDDHSFSIDSDEKMAFLVRRKRFDHFLLKRALKEGVDFVDGCRVNSVSRDREQVSVHTDEGDYSAKALIGADGANGIVARSAGIRNGWRKDRSALCLQAEPSVDNSLIDEELKEKHPLNIYFGVVPFGYAWLFRKDGCVNIGAGGFRHKIGDIEETFKDFCSKFSFIDHEELDISGHILPAGGYNRKIQDDNILLAGDAAGFADSFAGEGIYYALSGGLKAGRAVSQYINDDDRRVLHDYQRSCERSFHKELKASLKFSKIIHKRAMKSLTMLEDDEDLKDYFTKIPQGKKTYREFYKEMMLRLPSKFIRRSL